jgi:dCMP deaminase
MPAKPKRKDRQVVLLYVPVLHQGYLQFFAQYNQGVPELWLIGSDLAKEFSSLHTEIREVDPYLMKRVIESLGLFREVSVLRREDAQFPALPTRIITAKESVSDQVVQKYFPGVEVVVGDIFLRYDEKSVLSKTPAKFNRESQDVFDRTMIELACDEAKKSSDWWRRVGAVLVKDRQVITVARNAPVPSEHTPYVFGNPRDHIPAGTLSHFSDVLHAEKAVLAELLRRGISAKDADIYVTVFPCPDCAKLIAYSGIKRCFFASGHATLDGVKVMKAMGVELVYVPLGPRA